MAPDTHNTCKGQDLASSCLAFSTMLCQEFHRHITITSKCLKKTPTVCQASKFLRHIKK